MKKKSKKELSVLEQIKILHAEMKQIVLDAGVQEPQYNYAIKNLNKQIEEFQIEFLEWLMNFKNGSYGAVKSTLDQFSGWEYYKINGINHFPEQIILRRRQKALREAWHNRLRPEKKRVRKKNEHV